MRKYYSHIGDEHHRFCAVNQYAARKVAQSIAQTLNVAVWTDPVRYNRNVHGQYFWEYAA